MKSSHGSRTADAGRAQASTHHHHQHQASAAPARLPGSPRRILLAGDSLVSRELLKVYLIAPGVELLEAADGFEAVDVVRRRRPDVVLADARLPHLDGAELCRHLREDPELAHTPVLILTSSRDPIAEARFRAAGACEVLHKPIQPQPLQQVVRRHLPLVRGAGRLWERRAAGAAPR